MTLFYGMAIALGALGLLVAIALALNPERRAMPPIMRHVIVGVFGFGIAGMSSSFGGWPAGLSVIAAAAGAAVLVGLGMRYAADAGVTDEMEAGAK